MNIIEVRLEKDGDGQVIHIPADMALPGQTAFLRRYHDKLLIETDISHAEAVVGDDFNSFVHKLRIEYADQINDIKQKKYKSKDLLEILQTLPNLNECFPDIEELPIEPVDL